MSKSAELFYAEARRKDQQLVALGLAESSTNPAHPQVDIIRSIWHTQFLARNPVKPIVLHMGQACPPVRSRSLLLDDEVMAVKLGGESRLITTLADKSAVPCRPDTAASAEVFDETLRVALSADISAAVVNYYFDRQTAPHASEVLFHHQDFPVVERFATDARSWVLGQNVVRLWNEGYSPFVLYDNPTVANWPAQAAFATISEFVPAEPITLLPPTPPYAALPRLAPVSV